jgi:DNA-binding transcriptional ArsR family regulator
MVMSSYERALAALADPTRRRILELIAPAAMSVGDITRMMPISQPAVSQHLAQLKAASLVDVHAQGRRRLYRVDQAGLIAVRTYLEGMWTDVLESYRRVAEEVHHEDAGS